jgi:Zn ribbon nucleic-acid-binding protein
MADLKFKEPLCPKCDAAGKIGVWLSTIGPQSYGNIVYCTECGFIIGVFPDQK